MSNDKNSTKPINYGELSDRFSRDMNSKSHKYGNTIDIELDKLSANKNQTRFEYDDFGFFELSNENVSGEKEKEINAFVEEIKKNEDMNSLITSIKNFGLQQPIGVSEQKTSEGTISYQVIFGHRRVFAYKVLAYEEKKRLKAEGKSLKENKFMTIKAILCDNKNFNSDDFENIEGSLMLNIVENLYRKDLNLIEKGVMYERLAEQVKKEEVEKISKEIAIEKANSKAKKTKGEKSIRLEKVANFLGVKPREVFEAVRTANLLHPSIVKEILESKKPGCEVRTDGNVLQDLTKLNGYPEQQLLWDKFKKSTISRETMKVKIIETKMLLGLALRADESQTIESKNSQKIQKSKSGIRFVKDNQGFKIRNKEITELSEKENSLLETKVKKAIFDFFKEKKKILFDEKMGNDSTEE